MSVCLHTCLSYRACKLHYFYTILYKNLLLVCLYHILPHYLINSMIFRKKFIEHKMCVLIFSIMLVCNISHFKISLKYYHKFTLAFKYTKHDSCQISIKLEFSQQNDMTRLIVAFCNFANVHNENATSYIILYKYNQFHHFKLMRPKSKKNPIY